MVVIALSVMIFTATTSVIVGLKDAPAAFAASEGYVITSAGAPTIFSSKVSMDMASALSQMDNITGVSPEVFAFSSWNGHSFVVRGVDFEMLETVGPRLVTETFAEPSEGLLGWALLGGRLADRLDMSLPSTIPLPGSYTATVELVVVAGTFTSNSPLDDEMLVTADVARRLSGVAPDEASVIRVAASDPGWLSSLLSPEKAMFTIYDLSASKGQVGPGEACVVSVSLRNWGGSPGSARVFFADGGAVFSEKVVPLNASSSSTVSAVFESDSQGPHDITASVSGDFPVTLSVTISVVEPYLVASFPRTVMLGSYLDVSLVTYTGEPAPGVTVTLLDSSPSSDTTDASGTCELHSDEAGVFNLVFDPVGTEFAGMPVRGSAVGVEVVDTSSYPSAFLPQVTSVSISPTSLREGEAATVLVTVENGGSVAGVAQVDVMVDSVLHGTIHVPLGPADGTVASYELKSLEAGRHTVQVGDFSSSVEVTPWYADNPDLVELVLRYGGSSTLSSAGALPIYQAAKISEGNIALTLFALGAIAALLTTLAIVSVFSKEARDGRKQFGILRALGASRHRIRTLVFPQALGAAVAGSLVGISAGLVVTWAIVGSGAFVVFGHVLEFGLSPRLVLLTLLGATVISVVSALASAEFAVRETTMSSIRDLPDDEGREDESADEGFRE